MLSSPIALWLCFAVRVAARDYLWLLCRVGEWAEDEGNGCFSLGHPLFPSFASGLAEMVQLLAPGRTQFLSLQTSCPS